MAQKYLASHGFYKLMYHATINGGKTLDIDWDGISDKASVNGKEMKVDMVRSDASHFHIIMNDRSYSLELVSYDKDNKTASVKVNGNVYSLTLKDRFDDLLKSLGMEGNAGQKVKELKAPMPGLVLDILINEGQSVEKDSPLLILEAMKMENVLKSPVAGTIKKVTAIRGNAVEKNAVLLEFA